METSSKNSFVDNNDNFRIYNKKRKHSISFEIIYDKYKNEFIDNCEEILIKKEEDYLNFFFSRMKIILQDYYTEDLIESNIELQNHIIKAEQKFKKKIYNKMYNLCFNEYKKYSQNLSKKNNSKTKEFSYLTNYRSHCYYDQVAFHKCKGRFITVSEINSNSKILYVICTNCKMCYYESSILMYCINCKKEFYSSIIPNINKFLPPATWEKYHCNILINEQMSCIKCGDKFWIKNSNLYCKKCKLVISPLDVIWTCLSCHKEFKSYAKIYNPLEFKLIKLAIKNAKINKRIIKPKELPCGCLNLEEINNTVFTHKINGKCNGILYYGEISGKGIIVCSSCKILSSIHKFHWFCPKCHKSFITKNIYIEDIENNMKNKNTYVIDKNQSINSFSITTKTSNNNDENSKEINNLKSIKNEYKITEFQDKINSNYESSENKRRNLSISLLNKNISKSKINICTSNSTKNYENSFEEKYNDNRRNLLIKYPTKRIHLSLTRKNNINIFNSSINSKRIKSNEKKKDERKDSLNNYKNKYYNKNYQIYIPKKKINLFNSENVLNSKRKESSTDKNSDYSDYEFENYRNIKGINRFRIKYKSPSSSERKQLQIKFNEEESDHREKVRELSKKKSRGESPNEEFENEFYNSNFSLLSKSPDNNKVKNNYCVFDKTKLLGNNNIITQIYSKNKENKLKSFNLNDYNIITQLGQGNFGKIYLVENDKGELFSMKKIILSEELDLEDIIKEYNLCYNLKNDNIVKIIGLYNTKLDNSTYVIYILMEVGLTDWEKEIKCFSEKSKNYSEEELINIIKQLTSALSFLQKKNVSHRDIKPQNIVIFKNKIYKIADFGEAKQIKKLTNNLQTLKGTEIYMSPLLFNGLRTNQIDIKHNLFKSDVYSFGLCIFYASTLNIDSIFEIRKYIYMNEVRKFITKNLENKYSKKFIELIESMLEINENNRPDFIDLEKKMNDW